MSSHGGCRCISRLATHIPMLTPPPLTRGIVCSCWYQRPLHILVPRIVSLVHHTWQPYIDRSTVYSPRWLYSVGRTDQARRVLANLHSRTKDPNSPLVDVEMDEIIEKIQIDGPDKRWWDFRPLFRTRANRYSAYMCILIGACSHPQLIRPTLKPGGYNSKVSLGSSAGTGLSPISCPFFSGRLGSPRKGD